MKSLTLSLLLLFTLELFSQNTIDTDCYKVPKEEVFTDPNSEFKTIESTSLWEKCEILDGGLILTIPRGSSVKLLKRRFDWWNIEFEGKTGWVLEDRLRLNKCMYWLNNVGNKAK
jgi:hypothetical protein